MTNKINIISNNQIFKDILSQHLKNFYINYLAFETNIIPTGIDDIYIFDEVSILPDIDGKIILLQNGNMNNITPTNFLEKVNIYKKPFYLQILLDEINHWFKINEKILLKQDIFLYKNASKILINKEVIYITEKERALLEFISCNNTDQGASKEEIMQHIWHYSKNIETHTLNVHLHNLRKKTAQDLIIIRNERYYINDN